MTDRWILRGVAPLTLVVATMAANVAVSRAQAPAEFRVLVDGAERLQAARETAADDESRAAATLEWLRALRRVAAAIPFGQDSQEPYGTWLAGHRDVVAYDEPGGQWMLASRLAWEAHDDLRDTKVADELAWLAATNGLPGECEGHIACYLRRADLTIGEYLRRRPAGAHVEEAVVDLIVERAYEFELLSSPNPGWFFEPGRDCGELVPAVEALSAAVGTTSAPRADDARRLLEMMGRRCGTEPR